MHLLIYYYYYYDDDDDDDDDGSANAIYLRLLAKWGLLKCMRS